MLFRVFLYALFVECWGWQSCAWAYVSRLQNILIHSVVRFWKNAIGFLMYEPLLMNYWIKYSIYFWPVVPSEKFWSTTFETCLMTTSCKSIAKQQRGQCFEPCCHMLRRRVFRAWRMWKGCCAHGLMGWPPVTPRWWSRQRACCWPIWPGTASDCWGW